MSPIGSRGGVLLNQSTHSGVAYLLEEIEVDVPGRSGNEDGVCHASFWVAWRTVVM